MKNLKGELTTQQIVLLIILITSFAIILFFFFKLNLGEETDKELCHNSVVLKGSLPSDLASLNCYRSYDCLTEDGTCEGITNPEVEKVDTLDDVYKKLAESMVSCWWMFGEGKIDYAGEDWSGYHCAVCSNIKFDNAIQNKISEINYQELYIYLKDTPKDKTHSYLSYLYDSNSIDEVKERLEVKEFKFSESFLTNERYVILTGLNPNWPSEDSIIPPYFVESNKIKDKTECNVFDITKA